MVNLGLEEGCGNSGRSARKELIHSGSENVRVKFREDLVEVLGLI